MLSVLVAPPHLACMEPAPFEMLLLLTCVFAAPSGLAGWIIGSAFNNKAPAFWLAVGGTVLTTGIMIGVVVSEACSLKDEASVLITPLAALACGVAGLISKCRQPAQWRRAHFLAGAAAALATAMLATMMMG